ncbi:hypothetical protein GOP47_0028228 [Adiantum capillus-veneris]|nr:hypothetical protein GOP47_0028228 [Adiantum capillus-veneris]
MSETEGNTDYSGDKSKDEGAFKQRFSLNMDKYSQFLHNGYHMQIEDDSTGTLSTSEGVGNYACHVGMGEYEINYSSGYDSDNDIAQWFSTSDECLANCFYITVEDDLYDMGLEENPM